jgi:hypothetical protein
VISIRIPRRESSWKKRSGGITDSGPQTPGRPIRPVASIRAATEEEPSRMRHWMSRARGYERCSRRLSLQALLFSSLRVARACRRFRASRGTRPLSLSAAVRSTNAARKSRGTTGEPETSRAPLLPRPVSASVRQRFSKLCAKLSFRSLRGTPCRERLQGWSPAPSEEYENTAIVRSGAGSLSPQLPRGAGAFSVRRRETAMNLR